MEWPTLRELPVWAPMPDGYQYKIPSREDVPQLIGAIERWYPAISVGAASCYTRPHFYHEKVALEGAEGPKDILVLMYMHDKRLVGVASMEREPDALSVYGRLAVIDPRSSGYKDCIGRNGRHGWDGHAPWRRILYVLATMKHPYAQMLLERRGYRLLGLIPGYDREVGSDGRVFRIFEALYAKVLISDDRLLRPDPSDQTQGTRALFELLFPSKVGN